MERIWEVIVNLCLKTTLLAVCMVIGGNAPAVTAATFSPDTASASSEFSSGYLATYTIDGSGMPAGFDETSTHATYMFGNHWTTIQGDTVGAFITWGFNAPTAVSGVYIWNHLSNGIASNAFYAPTLFDFELFSSAGSLLKLSSVAMAHSTNTAQFFGFGALIENVTSATFTVLETRNEKESGNVLRPFTGLAEVLFTNDVKAPPTPIPLPASAWLLGGALAALAGARRRRGAA